MVNLNYGFYALCVVQYLKNVLFFKMSDKCEVCIKTKYS